MKKTRLAQLLLSSLAIAHTLTAFALEQFDVTDGQTVFVKMSTRDFNRIAIQNGRVRLVKGADSSMVMGDKDDASGQVLIKPLVTHPFALFIFSNTKTYTLVVQPEDIPAESIILKEATPAPNTQPGQIEKAGSYEKSIKLMLHAMTSNEVPDGVSVQKNSDELLLWTGTHFEREAVYTGESLTGEQYTLLNTGTTPIRIAEQEFFKQGVEAVAADVLDIAPGGSARIYVIEQSKGAH